MTKETDISAPALSVHLLHHPVRALGPGTRAGLWCQGCSIHCPGCITPEAWEFRPENAVPVERLAERIMKFFPPSGDFRLTVSGGEPFDQAEGLLALLRLLNDRGVRDILIYSGRRRQDLETRFPDLQHLAAALVDGPFELGNATAATWKGSDNQTLHLFRPEFETRYQEWTRATERRLQLVDGGEKDKKYLVGIPRQEDAERLKRLNI